MISDYSFENAVLLEMGIEKDNQPEDYPSAGHLIVKATLLKNNIANQCGGSCKYEMPEKYFYTLHRVLEEDNKVKADAALKPFSANIVSRKGLSRKTV